MTRVEVGKVTGNAAGGPAVGKAMNEVPVQRPSWPSWPSPPNPGDLGRRLATRRAELGLSLAQVARQAGIRARYLDYLEKFPGHPEAATLRQLAAALHTTPTALLGADGDALPGRPATRSLGVLEPVPLTECNRLLSPGGIGRIAFAAAGGIMVFPVNYAMIGGSIVLRTGAGSAIAAHGDDPVSFEADHFDEVLGQGWSVLVHGRAHCVAQPGELAHMREEDRPQPWPAGERDLFVRIVPDRITGRRIRAQ